MSRIPARITAHWKKSTINILSKERKKTTMRTEVGKIYEETDYSIFKKLDDNRDLLESRVAKIKASISEKYILNPIIVNENFEVIDGQGRYEARKRMGLPIHYIIAPGTNSDDCRRMNKYNKAWSMEDYAVSFARSGNIAYQLLLKACEDTGLHITPMLQMTGKSCYAHLLKSEKENNQVVTRFDRGALVFTETDYKDAKDIFRKCEEIKEALQFDGRLNNCFREAVRIIRNFAGYDHSSMLKRCQEQRSTFNQMSRLIDQVKEFERIYNYRIKKKIYFSDYFRNCGSNTRDYADYKLEGYNKSNHTDVSSLS